MRLEILSNLASFNLVIERLLISGLFGLHPIGAQSYSVVSISLSSGFSFQVAYESVITAQASVSISLSSGFSFQVPSPRSS